MARRGGGKNAGGAASPPTVHRLEIPRWHPARLNELLAHPMKAHRLKRSDRDMVAAYARLFGIPAATGPRRVRLTIVLGKGQRGGDTDAYWKSLLDSLVQARLLTDDNRQGVVCEPPRFARADERATVIELEDLP